MLSDVFGQNISRQHVYQLPAEVIWLIAGILEPVDLFSLRLVCREVCSKTIQRFFTFFNTVRTDLTPQSLQRLSDISNCAHLVRRVHVLRITYKYTYLGRGYQGNCNSSGQLLDPLPGIDLLQGLLIHRLVNCRSFDIDGYDKSRVVDTLQYITPCDIIGILFAIVAKTSLAIRSLTVQISRLTSGRLDTKWLRTSLCRQEEFMAGWAHLEALILGCQIMKDQHDWVIDLIMHAPRLQKLNLKFQRWSYDEISSLIQRLVNTQSCRTLKDLSLQEAEVTQNILRHFLISTSATLQSLSLKRFRLSGGDTWRLLPQDLADNLPCLNYISVFYLGEISAQKKRLVQFNRLTEMRLVPGSELRQLDIIERECRLVPGMNKPLRLTWRSKGECREAISLQYSGSRMANILHVLAEVAELAPLVDN